LVGRRHAPTLHLQGKRNANALLIFHRGGNVQGSPGSDLLISWKLIEPDFQVFKPGSVADGWSLGA
jgi:hypothetical protein